MTTRKPDILIMGKLYWAQQYCSEELALVANVMYMESSSREELFRDLSPGGRYGNVVGVYHEHLSATMIGHPDAEMLRALPASCRWFAHKGAGYDSVNVAAAKERGIVVSNTPGAVNEATATTALYLVIACMRRFSMAEAHLRAGGFTPPGVEQASFNLWGKTIGILGMGSIGLTFTNYIRPFGMRMVYHNRRPSNVAPSDVEYIPDMYDMLAQVDILLVSCPLNDSTRGLIGRKEIAAMKRGSILVNTARGPIVNEEEMILALQSGHLASVGLDVFTKEPLVDQRLVDMPHVTLLPHVGTENQDARREMETLALKNLRDFVVTGTGESPVPECIPA